MPAAELINVNGVLYGTTTGGGESENAQGSDGTAFWITTSGSEHVIHSFAHKNDGNSPSGKLIYRNGLLYGMTAEGGITGDFDSYGDCF